ncbi:hypothetical protein NEHOM01_1170 [Nematocida homosporus]|uniref:uncharacterized protein n=1 Tax=Nematocida homosporus TaxID=1912981 RepID=UPI00221F6A25|nr:uncharacterized protein NEHOM01_1170 [Nematocida homosporus]KAI5185947.1 hypothetical protein NEHOM01_1170 [Nematocida homosporus]
MSKINQLMSYFFAISPITNMLDVNIWNFYRNDCFLTWDQGTGILHTEYHPHIEPPPQFKLKYSGHEGDSPVKAQSHISIWTDPGYAIGKCRYTVKPIVPRVERSCSYHWVFVPREDGGLFIKPVVDQTMCMHVNEGRVVLDTCRDDRKGMAFMYGTQEMRHKHMLAQETLRRFQSDPEKSHILKEMIQSGEHLYSGNRCPQDHSLPGLGPPSPFAPLEPTPYAAYAPYNTPSHYPPAPPPTAPAPKAENGTAYSTVSTTTQTSSIFSRLGSALSSGLQMSSSLLSGEEPMLSNTLQRIESVINPKGVTTVHKCTNCVPEERAARAAPFVVANAHESGGYAPEYPSYGGYGQPYPQGPSGAYPSNPYYGGYAPPGPSPYGPPPSYPPPPQSYYPSHSHPHKEGLVYRAVDKMIERPVTAVANTVAGAADKVSHGISKGLGKLFGR